MGDSAQSSTLTRQESPAAILGWLGVLLIGTYLLLGPRLELHSWRVEPETNAALEEAIQWKNPLATGYSRIYEGRTDPIGGRRPQAIFSADYVPMHLWAMTIA